MKDKLKAVLIDHDDSFTFNLQHWLHGFVDKVEIINHKNIHLHNFQSDDLIVLSPGPKSPSDYPHILNWLKNLDSNQPLFGVCLGMQLMTLAEGGVVTPYSPPLHGKTSRLVSANEFNDTKIARYHSLKCDHLEKFNIVATSENIAMWVEHKNKKWLGVQFHPESFLTENTKALQNYIKSWVTQ